MSIPRPMTPDAVRADVFASLRHFHDLVASMPSEAWSTPTECPGWDVHDVVAHVVTFESMLAGEPTPEVDFDDSNVRNDLGRMNEAWVESVRSLPHDELLAQLSAVVARRQAELDAMTPADFDEVGWSPVGQVPRSRFLQVRVMDVWFHEQDIREAIGRPGGQDRLLVERVLSEILNMIGYVVVKRAKVPDGTSVRFQVEVGADSGNDRAGDDLTTDAGEEAVGPVIIDVVVDAGRATVVAEQLVDPTVTVVADAAAFSRLVGARRDSGELVAAGRVEIVGDAALGKRLVAGLGYMI